MVLHTYNLVKIERICLYPHLDKKPIESLLKVNKKHIQSGSMNIFRIQFIMILLRFLYRIFYKIHLRWLHTALFIILPQSCNM